MKIPWDTEGNNVAVVWIRLISLINAIIKHLRLPKPTSHSVVMMMMMMMMM